MTTAPFTSSAVDRRAVLAGLAGLCGLRPAMAAQDHPSFDLARGVNLSHWFAQSFRGYGPEHLDRFVTAADIERIAAAGFRHVRLGFEPEIVFSNDGPLHLNGDVVNRLLNAITMIHSKQLSVVLDMHPVGTGKDRYLTPEGAERFVAGWSLLAQRFATMDQTQLALEILNEPEPLQGEAWWTLQGRAIDAIRAIDPRRTLIVNGGGWSGFDDLLARTPYPQDGLIYTAHHYAPFLFTHQSADWGWDVAQRVRGLDWPIAPADAERTSQAVMMQDNDRAILRDQIARGQFTEAALTDEADKLAAWSEKHGGKPIYVGEFGVYLKAAPKDARLRWLAASRRAFERHGWGWAHWDNSTGFGFRNDAGEIDPATLQALHGEPT